MAGRPKKAAKLRMTVDLRIPVTPEQKSLIDKAVTLTDKGELAGWARDLIMRAAQLLLANKKKRKTGDSNPSTQADPSGGL